MSRREYCVTLRVNRRPIEKVVIDPHFEEKHANSITDQLIIELVKLLDGLEFKAEDVNEPYNYFVTDLVFNKKNYRLVWLLEDDKLYVGVINAYRRRS